VGREGQTAGEFEGGPDQESVWSVLVVGVRVVLACGGQEQDPEGGKGAHVKVENGYGQECPADVTRPDTPKGKAVDDPVLRLAVFGKAVQLNTALSEVVGEQATACCLVTD